MFHLVNKQKAPAQFCLICLCCCLAVNIKPKDKGESEVRPAEAVVCSGCLTEMAVELLVSTVRMRTCVTEGQLGEH